MLEFAINDFIKSISFIINEIKVVKTAFDELLIFIIIIVINEYNDITLFDCEYTTFFIYYAVNNQVEFDCFRVIKHMSLSVNCYKDIVNFIESYKKELNEIRLR